MVEAEVEPGQSIYEIAGGNAVTAYLNGTEVDERLHRLTIVNEEDHLVLWPVPQGGDVLRSVALIAVAIAAGPIAAAMGFTAGTTAFAVAKIGIGIAGSLLVNTLIPPSVPETPSAPESFNRLNSLTGQSNRVASFQAIPRIYGTHRFFPPIPMTAKPYTEIAGDDQYLRMMVCLGYGPLEIDGKRVGEGYSKITQDDSFSTDAVRIGDTNIFAYEDVEFEIGRPDEITLYSNEVTQTNPGFSTDNTDVNEFGDINNTPDSRWPYEGYYTKTDGESAIRTTDTDTDEISIDLTGRLYSVTGGGDTEYASVVFRIEYKEVGAANWIVEQEDFTINSAKKETVRRNYRWRVPRGQYEVRLTRKLTVIQADAVFAAQMSWTALRSIKSSQPFIEPDTVVMALRIKATDQLNGRLENLSILATSVLDVWDGSQWVKDTTSNPAWAFVDIWTGKANRRPLSKSDIDVDSVYNWSQWCDGNNFFYNRALDSKTTTIEAAKEVASCGLANWNFTPDSKIGIIRDEEGLTPRMLITPRNSYDFNFEVAAPDIPEALRVQFIDAEIGEPNNTWENTERLVFDDGYDENNAELYETLQAPGCTNSDQAWKFGRYHLAQQRLRPERFNFSQDVQHLRYQRGDVLLIQYDTILVGLTTGRIKQVVSNTEIVLDEIVEDTGEQYGVRIQKSDGSISTVTCSVVDGPVSSTLSLDSAVSGMSPDDLVVFGEAGKETIPVKVSEIQAQGDLAARVTCVPRADGVNQAITGQTIPSYNPGITEPVDPNVGSPSTPELNAAISNITNLVFDAEGGTVSAISVNIALTGTSGFSYKVQLRYREEGTSEWAVLDPTEKTNIRVQDVTPGISYEIQVRAVRENKFSSWSATTNHTVYLPSDVASSIPTIVSLSQLNQPLPPINSVQSYIVAEYTVEGVQPPPEKVELKWQIQGGTTFETRTFEVEPGTSSYSVRLPIDTYGVTYEVRARAKGRNGIWSEYSNASTISTTDPVIGVSEALDFLQGEITESQLFQSLNDRIDLIDASAAVSGSVNQRIEQTASELNGDIVAVEQTASTNASNINGLEAQYTVKIDNNGSVAGFGLASTSNNDTSGGAFSEFYVNADRFAITSESESGVYIPFIVQTSGTFNNGEFVPAGVYIEDAFIKNGDVETLKIGDNAVTVPDSDFTVGPLTSSGFGNSVRIARVFITNTYSESIFCAYWWNARAGYTSGVKDTRYFTLLNGSTLQDYGTLGDFQDFPSAGGEFTVPGNSTEKLELFFEADDSTVRISDITLISQAVKK
jgi:predicted phage tail protein